MNTSSRQIAAVVAVVLLGLIVVGVVLSKNNKNESASEATPATNTVNTHSDENNAADNTRSDESTPADTTTNSTTESSTDQTDSTIAYSNGSFSPASVTVKVNGTVKFVNNDSKSVNIASDPHPSHTDYQALNLGLLLPGKTSSAVTFTKAGTFGYHNHLNTTETGTVIVK